MSSRLSVLPACRASRCNKSNSAVVRCTAAPSISTLLLAASTTSDPTTAGWLASSAQPIDAETRDAVRSILGPELVPEFASPPPASSGLRVAALVIGLLLGLGIVVLVYVASRALNLATLNWILGNFLGSVILVIVVLFQDRNVILDAEIGQKYLQGQRIGQVQ